MHRSIWAIFTGSLQVIHAAGVDSIPANLTLKRFWSLDDKYLLPGFKDLGFLEADLFAVTHNFAPPDKSPL